MTTVRSWLAVVVLLLAQPVQAAGEQPRHISHHALSLHGSPALPAGFRHFPYANPQAPKGGLLRLDALGTFDSLNPFINRGVAADGLSRIYDTLTVSSEDEPYSRYGLLAERIEEDPQDGSWIIYHLRPQARFHDGRAVTSRDVVFSFETIQRVGSPAYKAYFAGVARVEALTPHSVKFHFRQRDNRELALIVGELAILPAHYWRTREFDSTSLEPPLGSGPYRISKVDPGRGIHYERVPDYWGRDLPVNRGLHNFDRIQYRYYRDGSIAFEGFKAGQYDIRHENKAKTWATEYNFPAVQKGQVLRIEQRHQRPAPAQGFFFNTRRKPLDDRRVREALAQGFDFEWANPRLFYNAYARTRSYYDNSELAAQGLPTKAELRILSPWRTQLPATVFGPAVLPPVSQGDGYNRSNLLKAQTLLQQAGWRYRDGALRNADGQPLVLEMLLVQPEFERIVQPLRRQLARLGVTLNIRILDAAQYVERLRQFDFDLTVSGVPASISPGNELWNFWSSDAARTPGSQNLTGLQSPVVDALIAGITQAKSRADLVDQVRSLDRVLRAEWLMIPNYHTPFFRIAAWDRFQRPALTPRYGYGLDSWWFDAGKARRLDAATGKP